MKSGLVIAVVSSLVTGALAVLLSWHFFALPLRPWPDQGWMLQAALRHAGGLGLTTQMSSTDLATAQYSRLTYFPPFYPLLVSGLLRLGVAIEPAVKGVNAAALLIGVFGWIGLARRFLSGAPFVLFAALLVASCGAIVPKGGTTDYIFWAAMPFWFGALLGAERARRPEGLYFGSLSAAILVAALVGIRWAAVFLVPAGGAFFLLVALRRRKLAPAIAAAVYSIVPGISYLAIQSSNRRLSGSKGSILNYLTPKWEFRNLRTTYPFQSVSTIPLAVEPLLHRAWRVIDPSTAKAAVGVLFLVIVPIGVILALAIRMAPGSAPAADGSRSMMLLVGLTVAVLIGFLSFMAVRYNWSGIEWTYLDEPRYFRPVWPAAALFWLAAFRRLPPRARVATLAVVAAGAIYVLQADARGEIREMSAPDESLQLVRFVREIGNRPGIEVVFDNDVSDYLLFDDANLFAMGYPEPSSVAGLTVSRPATIWLVRRLKEKSAYQIDPDYDAKRFETMRGRFRAELAWRSSGGAFEVYRAPAPARG